MKRSMVGVDLVLELVLGFRAPVAAQSNSAEDWPLNAMFGASKAGPTACANGAGWCDDGKGLCCSDARPTLVAEIAAYDFSNYQLVGRLWFYLTSGSKRAVVFDFRRPVVDEEATWHSDTPPRSFDPTELSDFAPSRRCALSTVGLRKTSMSPV